MIKYFKGFKMKEIILKDSSIIHTSEMRELLMQSEKVSFNYVRRLRNPNRAHIPPKEKIFNQYLCFENLSESIVNIQSFNPETVILKNCNLQDYRDIPLNQNLKSLTYHSNRLALNPAMPYNMSLIVFRNILPEPKYSSITHLDLLFPGATTIDLELFFHC